MAEDALIVRGAREHNLRNIDVAIPRDRLTVITGLSGSGKSSLAFDTIYAEGQRRYVESLSAYARQFLGLMEKPDVDSIEGLSPAISIEQKTAGHNPRSTVGTVTEIYDYLRLLYARAGTPHCPNCGRPGTAAERRRRSPTRCSAGPKARRIEVLAPLVQGRKGEFRELFESVRKQGFIRAYVDGELIEVADPPKLNRRQNHTISVVVDRLVVRPEDRARLTDSVETALKLAEGRRRGRCNADDATASRLFSENYGCPTCGISHARAGAAPVLLQLAVRRLPDVRRARHAPSRERGAHPRRPAHLHPRGRRPPLGRAVGLPAQGRAPHARPAVPVRPQHAVGRAARSRCATACCTATPATARRRRAKARGKGSSRMSSVATRKATPTWCAWRSRSTCSPCRAATAMASGSSPSRSPSPSMA